MTRLILPLCAALLMATPTLARTVTVTGQNGATMTATAACTLTEGVATCLRQTQIDTANGGNAQKQRTTTATRGNATSTVTGTRLGGKSFSRTVNVKR